MQKLRSAIREYDNDRWRIISTKVGNGFSAAACKDKAAELASEEFLEEKGEEAEESPEDDAEAEALSDEEEEGEREQGT